MGEKRCLHQDSNHNLMTWLGTHQPSSLVLFIYLRFLLFLTILAFQRMRAKRNNWFCDDVTKISAYPK